MSKSWQTTVAVAREAPSGRTVVDSAVILAIDKRLTEAFSAMPQDKRCEHCDSTGDVHDQTGEWRGECTACDAATVARLRAVCRLLTLETAVPNDDATLMGCLFSVLGQIRRAIEHMRTQTANMQTLAESGAAEIARLTAELAQANAMCESLAASVQDLANAKAAVDEAHAIELADEKAVVDCLRSELADRLQKQRAAEAEMQEVRKDAVPEIDVNAAIAECYRQLKAPQGTKACVAFYRGAEWFREGLLSAAPEAPKP
jgi:hypothetical protein